MKAVKSTKHAMHMTGQQRKQTKTCENLTQTQFKHLPYMGTWKDHVDRADTERRPSTASSNKPSGQRVMGRPHLPCRRDDQAGSEFSCLVHTENMMS